MSSLRLNRRRRFEDRRPRWFQIPEEPDEDPNYDRFSMMVNVDDMDRPWLDLVNEHGFTAVVKVRRVTSDVQIAKRLLDERHAMRQRQLVEGSF